MCNWSMLALLSHIYPSHNAHDVILPFIFFIAVPFLLPCLPILISCFTSIAIISFRVQNDHQSLNKDTRVKDRASKTIVMLTGIYILFNIPYWVYVFLNLLYFLGIVDLTTWILEKHGSYFILFVTPLSIIINAGVNPLLYLSRIAPLRESVQRRTTRVRESVSFRRMSGVGSGYRVSFSRTSTRRSRCRFVSVAEGQCSIPLQLQQRGTRTRNGAIRRYTNLHPAAPQQFVVDTTSCNDNDMCPIPEV